MADTVSLPAVVRQEPGGQSGVEVRRRSRAPSQAGVPEVRCTIERVLGLDVDLARFEEPAVPGE